VAAVSQISHFLGVDGGNSKTHALVISDHGDLLGFGTGGPSDFQQFGLQAARKAWSEAMHGALSQAGLSTQDIRLGCFCLAGADLPEDYQLLESETSVIARPMPVLVKNDSLAALHAGLHGSPFGVTVVLGSGFNAAGRGKDGQEIVLAGLGYLSGDYGGGGWIAEQMIRAVMRAWDGRGPATTMREPVLQALGSRDEMDLIRSLRKGVVEGKLLSLVPIAFEAAYDGDQAAQSILTFIGVEAGTAAGTLIRRLGLQEEAVPVVLSTSIFRGKGPLLLDVIGATVHRTAPKARIVTPDFVPVVGAALAALEAAGLPCNPELIDSLQGAYARRFPELVRSGL
jgi:N-acetylglucosamine kinase-like BadF-type ATPase